MLYVLRKSYRNKLQSRNGSNENQVDFLNKIAGEKQIHIFVDFVYAKFEQ